MISIKLNQDELDIVLSALKEYSLNSDSEEMEVTVNQLIDKVENYNE